MQDGDNRKPTNEKTRSKFYGFVRRFNGFLVVGVLFSPAVFLFVNTMVKSLDTFHDKTGASGWYVFLAVVLFALPALVSAICLSIGIILFLEGDEAEVHNTSDTFTPKKSLRVPAIIATVLLAMSALLAFLISS